MAQGASFSAAIAARPLHSFQFMTVGLIMAALVIDGLDYQLLALLAPVILGEWGLDRGTFGSALAGALFGMAIGAAGGGWIGDRIGRLRTLVLAVVLFGAATMAVSRADSVGMLTGLRVIGGIGFGAAGPNAIALATEWLPDRLRSYVVALLAIGTPAGGMAGALVLPALLPDLGWRGVFMALGVLAAALGLLLALCLRESPTWLHRTGRAQAASRAAARIGVQFGEDIGEAAGTPAPIHVAAGIRLFGRQTVRLNLGIGLSFAGLTGIVYGLGAWMPAFLTDAGFTLEQALRASLAFNACSIMGALAAGWLVRAWGSRLTMLASTLAAVVCLIGFGLALENAAAAPSLAARIALDGLAAGIGACASVAVTTLYAMAAILYPPEIRSGGIGLGMSAGRIGGIGMSFSGGYLLDFAGGSAAILFAVLAGCGLIATSAGWIVRAHIPPK